jgi:outer membrane protein assembly factor BamE
MMPVARQAVLFQAKRPESAVPAQDRGIHRPMQNHALRPLRASATLLFCLLLAGCGNFLRVYKADLDQGNIVTREMVEKLKVGMTPSQVRYVLGTPLVTDTLNPQRWDYVYDYTPGTAARRLKLPEINNRRLTLWFEAGALSRIEGAEQMPEKAPTLPESRDRGLKAEPL